ncbi:hypothetical protein FHX82_003034 [Amycolatopsis bartoniae]|uniref:DUF6292 domain-containing protein n=1 Tax=Amycolatopsis bartoniae TaxID=941986 RepID=A0A8H9IUS3_9PSEU|nr:DUF6292 family protein [Amycolatopsis bartoniae]MBB2935980.1 hypothetical protein [Amycolatopsis bartoniae]GHF63248.1 hypothetical protein GCM10017566_41080 [Amycolatopsis bartoniae]
MDRQTDATHSLGQGLAGYLRAIATALDLPEQGTSFEISDTATAYIALRRGARRPGEDLMLVWSESSGWALAVETDPRETPEVLAHLGGDDAVPAPERVARFVRDVLADRWDTRARPVFAVSGNRPALAESLAPYVSPPQA